MATTPAPNEILCPDPSVHPRLAPSEDASKAALLAAVATTTEGKSVTSESLLTEDGRLSSRGAASSLKYARPQDLPGFPSRGATPNASLAAAVLAKDHTMKELWQPETSVVGVKAAAKAQKDGGNLDLWQPTASAAGSSAAVIAMSVKGLSPQIDRGYTDSGRTSSLVAAKQSHSTGRQRAGSVPAIVAPKYPDAENSTKNALNAALVSHRTSRMSPDGWDSEANQAARIKNLGGRMDREMFGEHPPVEPELEEQRYQAALRASAVSMAKQMYDHQNRAATATDTGAGAGAEVAHRRNQSSTSQTDIKEEALKYITLQDAAHKIAQERLAKLDKEMSDTRYREYYGYGDTSPKKSRLSMRRRPRAASEGERDLDDSDDERQARRIRSQMSQLSSGLNTVDVKQRQQDRAKLMAAAEKRVHARMHDMDEKVFQETGKVSQSMMDEWEAKAREKAELQKVEREKNQGKVAIGGGKFMDQAEIEAIAAAKLKPTLEEINDTAEKMRARDAEMKRLEDEQETAVMEEKMKQQQQKAEFKRIKEQDKAAARKAEQERRSAAEAEKLEQRRKEEEQKAEFKRLKEQDKAAAKKEKEERKAAQRAEKEEAKARRSEEFRKSREVKREEISVVAGGAALGEVADKVKDDKEREEEQNREAAVAGGDALEKLATRVKEDKEKEEEQRRRSVEEAGVTVGEIAAKVKADREFEEKEMSGETGEGHGTAVAVGAAGLAGVAGVAAYTTLDRQDTGPAPNTIGPHESDLANIVDPRVKPDPELQKATVEHPETGPAPHTIGPHKSDLANILDPRVQPDPELQKGKEPVTEGPHESDIANIVDPRVDSEPKEPKDDQTTDTTPALVAGTAIAVPTDKGIESQVGGVREDPKRKSSSRGVFSRLSEKFKRRSDEQKRVGESSTAKPSPSQPTEGAKVAVVPVAVEKDADEQKDEDDQDIDRTMAAEALIGVGAAGAAVATAVAVASPGKDGEAAGDEVSSISTEEERGNEQLEQYTTTDEHTGHHNFATLSPPETGQRLDLERHISAINDSSDSEGEGDNLEDKGVEDTSADRGVTATAASPITTEDAENGPGLYSKEFGAYERAGKGGVATEGELQNKFATYDINDPNPEQTEEMKENIRRIEREKIEDYGLRPEKPEEKESLLDKVLHPFKSKEEGGEASKETTDTAVAEERPRSPVSPIRPEEEIVVVGEAASSNDPALVVSSTPDDQGRSAPASVPAVTTASSEEDPSTSQPQKERKGIKGIFSKLTSKPEHKLTKRTQEGPSSAAESEKSEGAFVGGAKLTGGDEKDGVVSPVTTTSTGVAEEMGTTDGTVGDTQSGIGIGSSAREESPSSFKRHEEDLANPDDVSSSGAEEEEVTRGRAGRLARKLGLTRDKGKEPATDEPQVESNTPVDGHGGEEQTEEARDRFDESLAPPPAFAGQVKNESQSPARETKFQEEF